MRKLRLLVVAVAVGTLSGCLDLLEEIWITTTGSARMKVEVSLPRSLVALGGPRSFEDMREDAKRAEAELRADSAVKSFTFTEREEGRVYHWIYELEVDNAMRLPELHERMFNKQSDPNAPAWRFRLERTLLGYRFSQHVGPETAADAGTATDASTELGRQLGAAMLGGHYVTVRLHAPEISSANGVLDADRRTVEWKIPLADFAFAGQELTAEVLLVRERWMWIGGAVAVFLLIVFRRRRRA